MRKLAFQATNEEVIIFKAAFLTKMFLCNWTKKGNLFSEVPFKKDLFSFSSFHYH